jgi:cell division inhibitor SulA
MPTELTEEDHIALNRTLDRILTAYRDGGCDTTEARSALAHMMSALAIGNEHEFRAWLKPGPLDRWLETTDAARSAQALARRAVRHPDHGTAQ